MPLSSAIRMLTSTPSVLPSTSLFQNRRSRAFGREGVFSRPIRRRLPIVLPAVHFDDQFRAGQTKSTT